MSVRTWHQAKVNSSLRPMHLLNESAFQIRKGRSEQIRLESPPLARTTYLMSQRSWFQEKDSLRKPKPETLLKRCPPLTPTRSQRNRSSRLSNSPMADPRKYRLRISELHHLLERASPVSFRCLFGLEVLHHCIP